MHLPVKRAIALLFATFPFFLNAQAISPKITMEQGQVFNVDMTLTNTIAQQAMGQAVDFKVDGRARHSYKVSNATDDFYTLHHEAQQMSFAFNGMGSKRNFDSENKKDMSGPLGEPARAMLAKKYDLVMSNTGTALRANPESFPAFRSDDRLMIIFNMLRDLTTVTDPPRKGQASFFKVLPDNDVKVGDTWKTEMTDTSARSSTIYTLTSITDSTLLITFRTEGQTRVRAQIMNMESLTLLTSTGTGTVVVDRFTGIIKTKDAVTEANGTTEMMGNSTPVNVKTTISTIVAKATQ